jgi:hypothetical protein
MESTRPSTETRTKQDFLKSALYNKDSTSLYECKVIIRIAVICHYIAPLIYVDTLEYSFILSLTNMSEAPVGNGHDLTSWF